MIYLVIPAGSYHGWGVLGKYLTREISKKTDISLIYPYFNPSKINNELDLAVLQKNIIPKEQVEELRKASPINSPILFGILGKSMTTWEPELKGSLNVGYTFFEENILKKEEVKLAKANFDLVVTGSTWCEEVLRDYGVDNVKTILQGIDPQLFNPVANEKQYFTDKFVIFSGGKLELRKGQDLVIKAFKILQDKYDDVLLVNSWYNLWPELLENLKASPFINYVPYQGEKYREYAAKLFAANGVDLNKVMILPSIPNTGMAQIYKNTDIGLFPNRCEGGTNLVLMEYMACGKPVIASSLTGHKDIVTDENSIKLSQYRNISLYNPEGLISKWQAPEFDEIVNQLEWAYHNREKLQPIGQKAGEDLSQLTWNKTAMEFYALLQGSA